MHQSLRESLLKLWRYIQRVSGLIHTDKDRKPLGITSVTFKAGPKPGQDPLKVQVRGTLLIVGPNNSGKTQATKDINEFCVNEKPSGIVISDVQIEMPTREESLSVLKQIRVPTPRGHEDDPAVAFFSALAPGTTEFNTNSINTNKLDELQGDVPYIKRHLLPYLTVRLDGQSRLHLVRDKELGELSELPSNHLAKIFVDNDLRKTIGAAVDPIVDRYLTVDATSPPGKVRLRFNPEMPPNESVERGLTQASVEYHRNGTHIETMGDGIKSFVGQIIAASVIPHRVLIIDEPEAFLHPPLSHQLGQNLSDISKENHSSLVVSTHSSEFVRGCIESSQELSIVRLTFNRGEATARKLTGNVLRKFVSDPLLRSAEAIDGLFHQAVVITESDSDRVFYGELNRQNVQYFDSGMRDAMYINAQNWQTTARIAQPLRSLGIPSAVIIDFDTIIKDDATAWKGIYSCAGLSPDQLRHMQQLRERCLTTLRPIDKSLLKSKGTLAVEDDSDRQIIATFIDELKDIGIFIVPVGELECWLPEFSFRKKKKADWIVDALEEMARKDRLGESIVPKNHQVWKFLDAVSIWCQNPKRLGIPD